MDGLVVMAGNEDDLIEGIDGWKDGVESGGIGVNVDKTRVMHHSHTTLH